MSFHAGSVSSGADRPAWGVRPWIWSWLAFVGISLLGLLVPHLWPTWPAYQAFLPPWGLAVCVAVLSVSMDHAHWRRAFLLFGLTHVGLIALFAHQWILLAWVPVHGLAAACGAWVLHQGALRARRDFYHPIHVRWWILLLIPVWWLSFGLPASLVAAWLAPDWLNDQWLRVFSRAGVIAIVFLPLCLALAHGVPLVQGRGLRAWRQPLLWSIGLTAAIHATALFYEINEAFPLIVLFGGLTFAPLFTVLALPGLLLVSGMVLVLGGVGYPYLPTSDSQGLVIRIFSWVLAYLLALHLRALQSESQARSRQTRALLMAVVTASPIGTVVRRFDAPVLRMNAACRAWFHDPALPIDSEEPVDLAVFRAALSRCEIGEIRGGQYVAVTDAAELFDAMSLGVPLLREHIALKAPGWPIVHLRLTSTLLHDADGKPTHGVIYAQDISRLVSDNLLLNGILDALPVGVLLRESLAPGHEEGANIYVNSAHLDIFGLTQPQALGLAPLPDALTVARAEGGEVIFSGQPQRRLTDLHDEARARLSQPTAIEVSRSPTDVSQAQMMLVDIRDVFGALSHVVMVSVDTRQLTEQQRLLRQLIRDVPLGLAIRALDRPVDTVVNRAMLEFLGLDEAQYPAGPAHWGVMEFGTLDAHGQRAPLPYVSPLLHSAETAAELSFGTCYVRRAAGEMRYAELRTLFLRDAIGRPTHVVEFALDRTKAVLQELLMAKLVAQSPVGVMVRDAQTFEPRYANQAMAAIVDMPLQALLSGTDYGGLDFGREVDGRLESFAEPPLQQVIQTGTAIDEGATFVRRADGSYRFTRSLHEVVHDASGRLVYVLAFVTDETYLRRQARLLRSLVSAMPLGLNVMELKEGGLVPAMTSPTAIQWSGLTVAQNMGLEPIPEGFHAVFDNGEVFASSVGQVRVRQFLSRQLKTGLPPGVRHLTVRRADGQTYFADYWFIPIHGPDGSMEYLLSVAVDQTHHKALQQVAERANAELRDANQRLKVIVENLPGGVAAFDASGCLLLANQALGVYLDLPPHMLELGGGHFDDMVRYRAQQGEYGEVDVEAVVRERHQLLALTEPFVDERARANGRVLELRTAPLPGGGMVTTYTDVTERKAAEDQIRQLAFYDVLTRLPNRRLLLDRLERAIEFSVRHANFGAVLFLDLDQFKSINDTRGHDAGDELLVAVAQRLQASVRDADTVARLGGDEFVVLLSALGGDPRTAAEAAHRVAGKLNQSLAAPYAIQGDLYPCTSSIGVTVFGREGDTVATILKQADIALYQAKDGGRNTVRFFDQAMQASVQARVFMEAGLRRALAQGEFHLEYQPQLNTDGTVRGAEVLLRWVAPDGSSISPAQFIPTAEDTALIIPIGLWVFEEVCWRVAGWQHQPGMARLVVSVNVSARQLREPDFVPAIASILHRTGVAPKRLMLELTESIVIQDLRDVVAKLDALKALGLGLSMDDFGTGYSSLSQLQRLPLDELKIDQSFVRDIETDPGDAAIARAVIAMALALDMEVVAEGVETPGQHAFLAEQGCSAYQGYWFSRPLMASRFEQWVLERMG